MSSYGTTNNMKETKNLVKDKAESKPTKAF